MKHNKPIQRVLSLLLAFVLLIGLLPAGAIAKAAETSPDLEPQETAYVQSDEASEEVEENGSQVGDNFSEATEELLATTETEPTEATTTVSTEPAETDPEVPAPIEPTEETEVPEITEPEESEPEATDAEEEPTETGVEAIIANAVTLTEASARAANSLRVWGEYVFNPNTSFQFGSLWSYGIKRLDMGGIAAYCIQPHIEAVNGSYSSVTIEEAKRILGENKLRAISLALAYGWPNTSYPSNPNSYSVEMGKLPGNSTATWQDTEKWVATQVITWEFALGYRNTSWPYTRTNSTLYNKCCKGDWGTWLTFQDTYNAIAAKLAKHNVIPSFADKLVGAAPTHELRYDSASGNYKLTLTDSKGVLSDFNISSNISGLTMTASGNNLVITATPAAAANLQNGVSCKLTSKTQLDVDPEKVVTVWSRTNAQSVITLKSRPDPASAYFKLKASAASTAKVIKKNSEAGGRVANFTFQLTDASGVVYETKQTDANGNITFTSNLIIGKSYTIHEVPAAGFVPQRDQYLAGN